MRYSEKNFGNVQLLVRPFYDLYSNVPDKEYLIFRRSYPEVFRKNCVLKKLAKFTGKHESLFVQKVAGLRPATLSKKRL